MENKEREERDMETKNEATVLTTVTITTDKKALERIGGPEYAEKHAGATYQAEIRADGWANIDRAKFDPTTFTHEETKGVTRQATKEERAEIMAITKKRQNHTEPVNELLSVRLWNMERHYTLATCGNMATFATDGSACRRMVERMRDGVVVGEFLVF